MILAILSGSLGAEEEGKTTKVVASTSWTAAFARAAGADSVAIIAPVELQHPPEYELKPSDLERVKDADIVIYAGYERFVEKLVETSEDEKIRLIKIQTTNDPENVTAQARRIAEEIGTLPAFNRWLADFDSLTNELSKDFRQFYSDKRVVVHHFQRPFVESLGMNIIGEFGPAQPSPKSIASLANKHPDFVIDNYHNPVGKSIAESGESAYAQFINFPGKSGTKTIEDVYRYNYDMLKNATTLNQNNKKSAATVSNIFLIVGVAAVLLIILMAAIFFLKARS